jgi:hypothetical protein
MYLENSKGTSSELALELPSSITFETEHKVYVDSITYSRSASGAPFP